MKKETRVFGVNSSMDVLNMTNKIFMDEAESEGYVWSVKGFQDKFNCLGVYHNTSTDELDVFQNLTIRFIEVQMPNPTDFEVEEK